MWSRTGGAPGGGGRPATRSKRREKGSARRATREVFHVSAAFDSHRRQPRAVVHCRDTADRRRSRDARRIAPTGVGGGPHRPDHRPRRRDHRLADAGRACPRLRGRGGGPRPLAGDVDRRQCAASLQHRGEVRPVRRLPRLGARTYPQRPAHRAGRNRFLLRRVARRHRGLRHPGRDHELAADTGRLPGPGGFGLRADLQHGAGGLWRARRACDRARRRHRPACGRARLDGRPSVARHRAHPAVLRHGDLWRHAFGPRAVAGAAGRGRQFRRFAVHHLQLFGLCADRRAGLARLADCHAPLPAGLAPGA